jgi:hypothetical protein
MDTWCLNSVQSCDDASTCTACIEHFDSAVPHGRLELASTGEVQCYTGVVPHGRPRTHVNGDAGSGACG